MFASLLKGSMIHVGVEKFHKNDHGYTLAEGKGQRQLSRRIAFPTRFAGAPQVLTGFSMLDVTNGKGYDFRVESRSSAIDEYGFDLCAKTCVEGKVWSTQLAWIAIDSRLLQGHAVNGLLLQSNSLKTSVHDHGYSLHRGEEGARHIDRQFGFVSHFSTPPTIATFLTAMDILLTSEAEALPADDSDNGEDGSLDDEEIGLPAAGLAVDARVVVSDENRTTFGFALRTATWGDARVWSATSSWIAIGKPALPRVENDMRDDEHDEEEDEEEEYEEYDHEHPELIEQDEEEDDFLPPRAKQMKRQLSIPVIAPTEPEEEEDVAPEPKKAKLEEKEEEEEAPAPKKVSSTLSEGSECKVCMDAAINTVLIPCGHMALCFDCVTLLRSKGNKNCPICKKNVESVVKTYKS